MSFLTTKRSFLTTAICRMWEVGGLLFMIVLGITLTQARAEADAPQPVDSQACYVMNDPRVLPEIADSERLMREYPPVVENGHLLAAVQEQGRLYEMHWRARFDTWPPSLTPKHRAWLQTNPLLRKDSRCLYQHYRLHP
jgi:hypothetical protein